MITEKDVLDLVIGAVRALLFLRFTYDLFPEEKRARRLWGSGILVFASNLTIFMGLSNTIPGSLLRQTILIAAALAALVLFARIQAGYAAFLATAYILGLGVWFNVITPFTVSQLIGMDRIPGEFPVLMVRVIRVALGWITLEAFRRRFLWIEPDGALDGWQTLLSVFPALVNFFTMVILYHSLFFDGTLVITDHFSAFAWIILLLALSSLTVLVLINRLLFFQRQREELRLANQRIRDQYEQFERQRQADEALRLLRHDMNNHLNTISGLLDRQGAAQGYVQGLLEETAAALEEVDTGNPTLNVILGQKQALAERKGVDLRAYVNWKQGQFISPEDICTLFGNCIDNALEAVERDGPEDRTVIVRGGVIANCLVVKFENHYQREPRFQEGLPVTSKTGGEHGLGLRSVRRVLERYGGVLNVDADESLFTVTWMIPLPQ